MPTKLAKVCDDLAKERKRAMALAEALAAAEHETVVLRERLAKLEAAQPHSFLSGHVVSGELAANTDTSDWTARVVVVTQIPESNVAATMTTVRALLRSAVNLVQASELVALS